MFVKNELKLKYVKFLSFMINGLGQSQGQIEMHQWWTGKPL